MDEKLRILLCEDDENLGMLLREYLQAKGYAAELYPDGEAGYKAFLKNKYDLCVFDVMMPKKDGFTLAQEVRAANAEIPIIFLTAKTLKEDILEGFKIGADDYITKPFSMEELTFRIEAILRRVRGKKNKESNIYKIGKFTFDTQKQILATAEKQTKLTTKESELLGLLCAHANEILQRDFAVRINARVVVLCGLYGVFSVGLCQFKGGGFRRACGVLCGDSRVVFHVVAHVQFLQKIY